MHTCSFGKENKADQSFPLQKNYFYGSYWFKISFYNDNTNQMSELTGDHM